MTAQIRVEIALATVCAVCAAVASVLLCLPPDLCHMNLNLRQSETNHTPTHAKSGLLPLYVR